MLILYLKYVHYIIHSINNKNSATRYIYEWKKIRMQIACLPNMAMHNLSWTCKCPSLSVKTNPHLLNIVYRHVNKAQLYIGSVIKFIKNQECSPYRYSKLYGLFYQKSSNVQILFEETIRTYNMQSKMRQWWISYILISRFIKDEKGSNSQAVKEIKH